MTRKLLRVVPLAILGIAAIAALAYTVGVRVEIAPQKNLTQAFISERLSSLTKIEARLDRLERDIASLRGALPANPETPEEGSERESDRWRAAESGLATLQLRVNGLEADPVRRGESFLDSENAEMRREGINILQRVARFDPKTRAAIRGLLHDPNNRVREQAAQVLGALKDTDSIPDMKALLADPDAGTRRRAVRALGSMEVHDAAQELGRNLVSDEDDGVRIAAADALGRLKSQDAVAPLTEALKDRNDAVRGTAIGSLGKIGAASAAPQLRAIYDQAPGNHRIRLALALKSLGDEAPLQKEIARLSDLLKAETDPRARQQTERDLALLSRSASQ